MIWYRWTLGREPWNLGLTLSSATFLHISELPLASIGVFKRWSVCSCVLQSWRRYREEISVHCKMMAVGDSCAKRAAWGEKSHSGSLQSLTSLKLAQNAATDFLMARLARRLSTLWLALFLDLPMWCYSNAGWSGAPAVDDSGQQ